MSKTEDVLRLAKGQGVVRPSDLRDQNLPPRLLSRLAGRGQLERVGRGLYRHPEAPLTEKHSLALASKRYPDMTICLLSALQFHELTTQWPREVWVALSPGDWEPTASPVHLRITRMSGASRTEGIGEHEIEGVSVGVFGPAKTVADCFKFRNKVGLDVAMEALRDYLRERKGGVEELFYYADICRVEKVMRPYIEALV